MNKKTLLALHAKARGYILKGVNAVYEAVRQSMGPEGGNALMYRTYGRGPRITNDGVTIAEVMEPRNEFENLAANAFKEAARKTNELAGDGTTATIVIAGKLLNDIFREIGEGNDEFSAAILGKEKKKKGIMQIRREILETSKKVVEQIKEKAKKIETLEELEKIAAVSVEDKELGKIIAGMAWEVRESGYIDVVEGHRGIVETELIKGGRFPAKVPAKVFVNNAARYEMKAEDAPVLLTNYAIDKGIMAQFLKDLKLPKLLIIAPDFTEGALVRMAKVNVDNGEMAYFPVKVPSLKTVQYEDIAIYTGARFINKDAGDAAYAAQQDLGFVSKLVVKDSENREEAVALGGKGTRTKSVKIHGKEIETESPVEERIRILQGQIEEEREQPHKNLLKRRIASLKSAVGIIRVGAVSQAEGLYKKMKIEDGVYACKAALEEGYVRGGGLCLKEIAETLPEDDLLRPALFASYNQIKENMEVEALEVGEDIIDPAKAIRCAVEHAVSVAVHLATVKVIIPEERDRNPSEGYEEIAKAIWTYAKFWARDKGIIKENDMEIARDNMREAETLIMDDNG